MFKGRKKKTLGACSGCPWAFSKGPCPPVCIEFPNTFSKQKIQIGLFLIVTGSIMGFLTQHIIFPFGSVIMISVGVNLLLDGIREYLNLPR